MILYLIMELIFIPYILYLVPLGLTYLVLKKVANSKVEPQYRLFRLSFWVPYVAWLIGCMTLNSMIPSLLPVNKSFSNLLYEPLFLSLILSFLMPISVFLPPIPRIVWIGLFLIALPLVVGLLIPGLSE